MDAVRNELSTGQATSAKMHPQKGREYAAALKTGWTAIPTPRPATARSPQQLLEQLHNALAGKP
jgi:hypothetical protein